MGAEENSALAQIQARLKNLEQNSKDDSLTLVVMSNNMDKCLAALIIATGAAAMGTKVTVFFTFWGVTLLRDPKKHNSKKNFIAKMFGIMLPKGASKLKLSQLDFCGMGRMLLNFLMRKKNVVNLPGMLELAKEMEIKFLICEMSMDLMGFSLAEMIAYPNLEVAGVATFLEASRRASTTLFI